MDEGRAVLDEMGVGVSVVLEERDAVRVVVGGLGVGQWLSA